MTGVVELFLVVAVVVVLFRSRKNGLCKAIGCFTVFLNLTTSLALSTGISFDDEIG